MAERVTLERLGFSVHIPDASDDPVLQSFILKELSRFRNVNASYVDGSLVVSIALDARLTEKGVGELASRYYSKILKVISVAQEKYRKYLELRDLLDTPLYRVSEALSQIPPLEA